MSANFANFPYKLRRTRERGFVTHIIIIAVVFVLGALITWHLFTGPKPPRLAPAQTVSVAAVIQGDMPEILSALGTVTPMATVNVLPQLSGYLTEVGYQEGQDVKQGQFLAQIDPRQYEISKRQAQAQLAKDQATLDQGRADLARYTQLHEQKSIAEQTYIDQTFVVQQAEAAVKADLATIAQDDLNLTYCHITAPVSGRVGLRLVDPGNYVTQSTSPGIVIITQMKPTTVQFTVPQNTLDQVLERVNGGNQLPVSVFNSDNSKQLATGTLYALSNQMATSTGTVTLRATIPNDDEALFPNEFVNVQLLVDTLHNAVLVPTAAVQSGAPGSYVYLVNNDKEHTVSVQKVTPGPSDGQRTVILKGLSAGQQVVTDGMDRLSDGARIKAVSAQPAGNSGTPHPVPLDDSQSSKSRSDQSKTAAAQPAKPGSASAAHPTPVVNNTSQSDHSRGNQSKTVSVQPANAGSVVAPPSAPTTDPSHRDQGKTAPLQLAKADNTGVTHPLPATANSRGDQSPNTMASTAPPMN